RPTERVALHTPSSCSTDVIPTGAHWGAVTSVVAGREPASPGAPHPTRTPSSRLSSATVAVRRLALGGGTSIASASTVYGGWRRWKLAVRESPLTRLVPSATARSSDRIVSSRLAFARRSRFRAASRLSP